MLHKSQNFVDERPLILGQTCKTDTFAYCGQHNKSETKSYQNILQKLRRIICIAFVAKRCNSETKKRQTEIIKNVCKNSDLLAYLRNRCRSNPAFPRGHLYLHCDVWKIFNFFHIFCSHFVPAALKYFKSYCFIVLHSCKK